MPAMRLMGLRDCVGVVTKDILTRLADTAEVGRLNWLSFDSEMAGAFAQHSEEL